MIGIASNAISMSMPWKKSVQHTALNPPRKVYPTIIRAKIIIAVLSFIPGNKVVNTDVPATKAEATYTVNATRKMMAHTI